MSYPKEAVLNGGAILQRLESSAMTLRAFYFKKEGVFSGNLLTDFKAKDLFQFCPETNELIVSRENTFYAYAQLPEEVFKEMMNIFVGQIFQVLS